MTAPDKAPEPSGPEPEPTHNCPTCGQHYNPDQDGADWRACSAMCRYADIVADPWQLDPWAVW